MEKNIIYIYIDPNSPCGGDGSKASPFRSVDDAKKAIRDSVSSGIYDEVVVLLRGGVYPPMSFSREDSGTEDCRIIYRAAEGEDVTFSGGLHLDVSDFTPISSDEAEKLYDKSAADKIVKIDLKKYGVETAQLGNFPYIRAEKEGISPELYINEKRMEIARFPNTDWLLIEEILGGSEKYPSGNTCRYSDEVNEHVKSWKYSPNPRAYGYFKNHWRDHDAGFITDTNEKTVTFTELPYENFLEKGRRYWFYGLFEELDAPGEYYIDKEQCILYLVAPEDMSDVVLSLSDTPVISINGADNISFESVSVAYTKNRGIYAECNRLVIDRCRVFGTHRDGVYLRGDNARIINCEVFDTGACGIFLIGGKIETLTPSGTIVYNNYIHNFSRVERTYTPGVELYGCGATVSHNDITDASHSAILFHGPLHTIEYNRIINVCNDTADCGAIYSGRTMYCYGTVVRYNYFKDIGRADIDDDFFCAQGIYYDDGLSGQITYGNIIENVTGRGIYVGGGRDNSVYNNIIINPGIYSIDPDDRMRDGAFYDGWFSKDHLKNMSRDIMNILKSNAVWYEKFPVFKKMKFDYENGDENDLDLFAVPAGNRIVNNVTYKCPPKNDKYDVGKFCFEAISAFSEMHDNYIMNDGDEYTDFVDYDSGDRTVRLDSNLRRLIPDFDIIPFDRIGRVDK